MRPYMRSLEIFLKQISRDSMLILICTVPFLEAALFGYGIPALERLLCSVFSRTHVLAEYYLLFDLLLAIITPYVLIFVSSMVMLTEADENMAGYLAITPITKKGYIISRLFFPALLSLAVSMVLLLTCALTRWTFGGIFLAALLSSIISIPIAMLIVAFSHNRVEGMALAKISGLVLIGLPVPLFLPNGLQYLFSWLPSFWMAKVFTDGSFWFALPAIAVSWVWIWALYRKFERKIQ